MAKNGTTKKTAKKTIAKLNDTALGVAQALLAAEDTGIGPGNWTGDARFPTRTLKALETRGLAKSKEKKVDGGEKATFYFATAATAKAVEANT